MSERKVYEATAERDDTGWVVRIPELGWTAHARALASAEQMARYTITLSGGIRSASFDVSLRPILDGPLGEIVQRAVVARGRAAVAQAEASNAIRQAANALSDAGFTVRDAGVALGVSHQRIAQLLASSPESIEAAVIKDAFGDGDRVIDVYSVARGHRRAAARELVDEARENGRIR